MSRGGCFLPLAGDWALWPLARLRSAGMPAERVLRLAEDGSPGPAGVSSAFAEIVADPWFQEAVTWQNPELVRTWLGGYAERVMAGETTLRHRSKRECVLARYIQRYATKNDTIGFFGPVAWARLDPADPAVLRVAAGDGRRSRRTYFEAWAFDQLARRWESDPRLRAHLCPWRDPSAVIEGDRLLRPRRAPVLLDADERAVLAHCDGLTTPAAILRRIQADHPDLGFRDLGELLSLLAVLAERRLLRWGFHLPMDERPEMHLGDQLAAVPLEVSQPYRQALSSLLDLRREVDLAAGDPVRLMRSLDAVSARYQEVAGTPGWRTKKERARGRGVLWVDEVTSQEVTVGGRALDTLRQPLELLLASCRWLTWRVAEGVAQAAASHVRARPGGRAPFAVLMTELAPELTGADGHTLDEAVAELQRKVAAALGLRHDVAEHRVACADVAETWASEFAAPGPGWAAARVHAPDFMLAAGSPEAANSGDFQWVVGEIHLAVNTLDNRVSVVNQLTPGQIERLVAASTPGDRYVPAFPRHWPGIGPRAYPPLASQVPDRFRYWAVEADDVLPIAVPRMPTAHLDVVVEDGIPTVTDRVAMAVPFVEFIGELLSFLVGNAFKPFAPVRRIPRVTLGDVVVQRETWHLPAGELVARPKDAALGEVLAGAGVPRFVFVQVPGDRKPLYCDLSSGVLVRNVARLLRASPPDAAVRVQEMIPCFGQLWLGSPDERRTSEFRMVAVDQCQWPL